MKRSTALLVSIFLIGIKGFSQDTLKPTELEKESNIFPPPPPPNQIDVFGDADKIFTRVEQEPEFPGGNMGWRKFLEKNLKADIPVKNNAPEGRYTVIVEFIVNMDGSVTDVKSYVDPGYGTAQEVIRIIKAGPKWIPARQNGRVVNAYKKQPVTFVVEK